MAMHAATADHAVAHQEEEGISRGMAGMVLFIASEVMLFGALFAAYFFVRNQSPTWPPQGVTELDAVKGGILTALLIVSGLLAHMGVIGARSGNNKVFVLGLGCAIILGTIFIAGQALEWFSLMDEGLNAQSGAYGGTFFVMTGFHGAHVIVGLAMLIVVFVRNYWRDFTPRRHLFVDASVLYWHFVDVVWVFLYAILYLWK